MLGTCWTDPHDGATWRQIREAMRADGYAVSLTVAMTSSDDPSGLILTGSRIGAYDIRRILDAAHAHNRARAIVEQKS